MIKLRFIADLEKVAKIFDDDRAAHAKAATAAIDEVGKLIKERGRENIKSAGFGKRWQNALRVDRFPKHGTSSGAALWVHHNIPYADVFENGATIHGKPLLWIPLSSAPKKIGGKRMSVKQFIATVGPLVAINPPGAKHPLLVAKYSSRNQSKLSIAGLRRGAASGGRSVPVFVGVPLVTIRKRFNLRFIFRSSAAQIGPSFQRHLRA